MNHDTSLSPGYSSLTFTTLYFYNDTCKVVIDCTSPSFDKHVEYSGPSVNDNNWFYKNHRYLKLLLIEYRKYNAPIGQNWGPVIS
jgi:hypothetical protein